MVSMSPFGNGAANAQGPQSDGMVCTYGPTFTLTTGTGYIGTPDGNVVYMWGLSSGSDPFQYPGPVLCVNQGETVTIVLHNSLNRKTSLIFPGQENVLADGQPDGPEFSGSTLASLARTAAANGGSVTYSFVAERPGTFVYQSGTETEYCQDKFNTTLTDEETIVEMDDRHRYQHINRQRDCKKTDE